MGALLVGTGDPGVANLVRGVDRRLKGWFYFLDLAIDVWSLDTRETALIATTLVPQLN